MNANLQASLETIQKNASIADTSLAEFIVACYNDGPPDLIWLTEALREVLAPTEAALKELLGIIVNEEGYFKWKSLDIYNKQMAVDPTSTDFQILQKIYAMFLSRESVFDYAYNATAFVPDVDFMCRTGITFPPNLFPGKMPATIGYEHGGWYFSQARSKTFPKDYCIGMAALKEKYPTAIDLGRQKHKLICRFNHQGFVDADPNDTGLATWAESDTFKPSTIPITAKAGGHPVADNEVGLIYVPFKEARKKLLNGSAFTYGTIDTCLPRSICEKYNLPVVEV